MEEPGTIELRETGPIPQTVAGKYRWVICALLFFATTINYIDRQILSLLKEILDKQIGWTNEQFGWVNSSFQLAYGVGLLGFGWFVDRFGTKVGYAVSIAAWSVAAAAHALVGSVSGFITARAALGLGESGNFPSAIKAVAMWFPKRERAFATSIFNSGTNAGALIAPAIIPWMAFTFGWQSTFLAAGAAGMLWLFLWIPFYNTPNKSKRIGPAELAHIRSDQEAEDSPLEKQGFAKNLFSFQGRVSRSGFWAVSLCLTIGIGICRLLVVFLEKGLAKPWVFAGFTLYFIIGILCGWIAVANQAKRWHDLGRTAWMVLINLVPVIGTIGTFTYLGFVKGAAHPNKYGEEPRTSLIGYPQTWSFIVAKFLTDPVWWFFLIWLPDYFKKTRGLDIKKSWIHIVSIYGIVTVLSIFGGWITGYLTKHGWSVTRARKTGMFIFALLVLPVLAVTKVGDWTAVLLIGLAASAHQAWSANLFTTVSDMFPKRAVASVVGIGGMAGSAGGFIFPILTGKLLDHFTARHNVTAGYAILFGICSCAYLVAFGLNHLFAPRFEPIQFKERPV